MTGNSYSNVRQLRLVDYTESQQVASSSIKTETDTTGSRAFLVSVVCGLALCGIILLFAGNWVQFSELAVAFPADVIAILLALDIFSRFVAKTGVLDAVGRKLAKGTKGRSSIAAMSMGLLMFASSAFLNNLAAIFVLAPIFLTLLRAMRSSSVEIMTFLSLMLVLCNLGGMATPMGDFPAILLMSSELVGFTPYLLGAFPLALSLSLLVIFAYAFKLELFQSKELDSNEEGQVSLHLALMETQNRHVMPDRLRAGLLGCVFILMVFSWALIPPTVWPFFMTAISGTALAAIIAGPRLTSLVLGEYDLKTLVVMSLILLVAAIVSALGFVSYVANILVANVESGLPLLIALMVLVTIASGLFSAGPATAAVLPVFVTLSAGPLAPFGDLVGIAFATSICAGSSMFMHSATAGPTLRGEALKSGLIGPSSHGSWGPLNYLGFGLATGLAQLALSIAWIVLSIELEHPWLLNLIPVILLIAMGIVAKLKFAPKSSLNE